MSNLPDYMPVRGPNDPKDVPNIVDLLTEAKSYDVMHTDLLDTPMLITDVTPKTWMSKDCAIATATIDGEEKLVLFTSTVLASQLLKVKDSLPVTVKATKRGKRYHFTL
jgi:hypothetical protein